MSSKNRRRYGGYIVHLGVVLIAVGIALSSTYRHEREATLRAGEAVTFQGYEIRLDSLYAGREPHREFVEAAFAVSAGGERLDIMRPRLNYYAMAQNPIGTPRVRTRPHEDLYLSLSAYARDGSTATVSIIVNPAIVWIWIGGGIMALGALFAISTGGVGVERKQPLPAREAPRRPESAEPAGVGGAD